MNDKTKIYRVNNPFMCRVGQFEENKQSLCIGLDVKALQTYGTYKCFLGKNNKTIYVIDSATALAYAEEHRSVWTNREGRTVAILPLFKFDKQEVDWQK